MMSSSVMMWICFLPDPRSVTVSLVLAGKSGIVRLAPGEVLGDELAMIFFHLLCHQIDLAELGSCVLQSDHSPHGDSGNHHDLDNYDLFHAFILAEISGFVKRCTIIMNGLRLSLAVAASALILTGGIAAQAAPKPTPTPTPTATSTPSAGYTPAYQLFEKTVTIPGEPANDETPTVVDVTITCPAGKVGVNAGNFESVIVDPNGPYNGSKIGRGTLEPTSNLATWTGKFNSIAHDPDAPPETDPSPDYDVKLWEVCVNA